MHPDELFTYLADEPAPDRGLRMNDRQRAIFIVARRAYQATDNVVRLWAVPGDNPHVLRARHEAGARVSELVHLTLALLAAFYGDARWDAATARFSIRLQTACADRVRHAEMAARCHGAVVPS
jgi:hypothetical protein